MAGCNHRRGKRRTRLDDWADCNAARGSFGKPRYLIWGMCHPWQCSVGCHLAPCRKGNRKKLLLLEINNAYLGRFVCITVTAMPEKNWMFESFIFDSILLVEELNIYTAFFLCRYLCRNASEIYHLVLFGDFKQAVLMREPARIKIEITIRFQ